MKGMSSDSSCAVRTRSSVLETRAGHDFAHTAACDPARPPSAEPSARWVLRDHSVLPTGAEGGDIRSLTPPKRPRLHHTLHTLCQASLVLTLLLPVGTSLAGAPALAPTATEALRGLEAPGTVARPPMPEAPNLYQAWNVHLTAQPDPSLLLLSGTVEGHASSSWFSPWVALGLGLLAGAVPAFFLARRTFSGKGASASGKTPLGGGPIELLASSALNDDGSVLVVDVMGEQLVLGVSGRRDFVTLLTKVGDPSEIEHLDPAGLQALIQARRQDAHSDGARAPAARASAPAWSGGEGGGASSSDASRSASSSATRSLMPPPMDEDHGQDEDLEELLDELLGKVRGLKPLAKHPDEP